MNNELRNIKLEQDINSFYCVNSDTCGLLFPIERVSFMTNYIPNGKILYPSNAHRGIFAAAGKVTIETIISGTDKSLFSTLASPNMGLIVYPSESVILREVSEKLVILIVESSDKYIWDLSFATQKAEAGEPQLAFSGDGPSSADNPWLIANERRNV